MATHTAMTQGNDPDLRNKLERKVGILHFVSPKEHGWNGVLRKRFTDFQVHEIDEDGQVVHLKDYFTNARDYDRAEAAKNGQVPSIRPAQTGSNPSERVTSHQTAFANSAGGAEAPNSISNAATTVEAKIEPSADSVVVKEDGAQKAAGNDEPAGIISAGDMAKLTELLDEATATELASLYEKVLADPKARPHVHGLVKFPQITDRSVRTALHSEIRRIFSSKIETETNSEGVIVARAQAPRGNSRAGNGQGNRNNRNNPSGQTKIGKFLHFSLYKENKDTMEAVNILSTALGMKPNFFSTAGTKDRRAVTVQRVSIRGRDPKRVLSANAKLRGLAIGDFKFSEKDLYLGSHNGNEFTIVMKDCMFQGFENEPFERQLQIAQTALDQALTDITKHGFINYFGTQRFGTYEIGTQALGMKILQGDMKGVVQDLLSFDPSLAATDPNTLQGDNNRLTDLYRAKALVKYKENNDPEAAAKALPRRCNTEFAILKHLVKQPTDFNGAVLAITRNMRNMYLHAYQSFVWNFVASKRWELFGTTVVKGDLVLVTADNSAKVEPKVESKEDEEQDEETIHLVEAASSGDAAKHNVHVLTAEDVASGRYTINDVVLSIPGTDVVYPENEIGEYYKEFMGKERNGALDPHNMRRPQKPFSLTGDYRKFMGTFIGTPSGNVRSYSHDNDQLVPTDLDLIKMERAKARTEAAAATPGNTASGWNSFAQKVQDDERKQAQDKFAVNQRRKAESQEEHAQQVRVNETWVQTSTDGSNKRVKVSTSSQEIESDSGAPQNNDESGKSINAALQEEFISPSQAKGPEQNGVSGTSAPEVSTTIVPTLEGSWLMRCKKVLSKLYDVTLGNLLRMFSANKTNRKTHQEVPQFIEAATTQSAELTEETSSKQTSQQVESTDVPMTDAPSKTGTEDIDIPDASQKQGDNALSLPVEEQKIAIVLKFSLGSSAYATMVLRELQG